MIGEFSEERLSRKFPLHRSRRFSRPLEYQISGVKLMAKISRIDALVNVVEYLIDDERDDYAGNPTRGHIYRSLLVLEKWIKEGVMTEEN